MRVVGTVLKVRIRLAFTPGGGSNVKIRDARSKLTGIYVVVLQLASHLEHTVFRVGKQL